MKKYIKFISFIVLGVILLIAIDLIWIFIFNKPLFAVKEDNGDSVNMVYRGLFYDSYNCFEHSMIQIKSKGSKFMCSYTKFNEMIESEYTVTVVDGVSISIMDVTNKGAMVVIKDINKNPYVYGEWYQIEELREGKWYSVNTIIDNYGFNEMGYLVNDDNEVKFSVDWEWLYGELSNGNYRMLKQVNNKYIAVLFEIN